MKHIWIIYLSILCIPQAFSLPTAKSFTTDNGDGTAYNQFEIDSVVYDRCDAPVSGYGGPSEPTLPTKCHRWGLVFDVSQTTSFVTWEPGEVASGYRWPTIKELSRLYDYTNGFSGTIIGSAYGPIITATHSNRWIVSSSYRDLDGQEDNDRLQIMAMNMLTGEIRAFEPGKKGSGISDGLHLCASFTSDQSGDCNIETGRTFYQILVKE